MSYQVKWYLPNRVMLVHLAGTITLEQVNERLDHMNTLLAERPSSGKHLPIYVLHDVRQVETYTFSVHEGLRATAKKLNRADFSWVIYFGQKQNQMVGMITGLLSHVLKFRVRHVETVQEALAFLQDIDSTLDFTGLPLPLLTIDGDYEFQ